MNLFVTKFRDVVKGVITGGICEMANLLCLYAFTWAGILGLPQANRGNGLAQAGNRAV